MALTPHSPRRSKKGQATLNAENTFAAIAREWHEKNLVRWSDRMAAYLDLYHGLAARSFAAE
jgi:hypothetical protein